MSTPSGCMLAAHTRDRSAAFSLSTSVRERHWKPRTPRRWQAQRVNFLSSRCKATPPGYGIATRSPVSIATVKEAVDWPKMRHSGPTSECVPFPGLSVLTMRKVARFKNKQKILTHIYRLAPLTPKPHLSAHRTHCCSHLNGIFRNIINYRDECIRCHFFCLNGEK